MLVLRRLAGRLFGTGGGRESASFGAALLGVLLLAGAAFGNGIARTSVEVSDGLTWLGDDQRGEVVQVNPASGKPQTRLQISGADARLEIAQEDGRLVILDRRTGQITVIDLSTLLASGRRQAPAGPSSKVLVANGHVFVVDRAAGTVHTADPVTLADVGTAWQAGQPLADVVVDDRGVVWLVDHGGTLRALEWSDEEERFLERSHRPISGAGPRTVLVPHDAGVTLIGLDAGVVVQDGTGADRTATTVSLSGEVIAAQTSPDNLVPASVPSSGTVVLVVDGQVVQVDVGALGCPKPGRPAVFRDKVYVPCRGSGKVIVLDRGGKRGGDDVQTSGSGDPELVFDDGRLFVNVPGSSTGVLVDADGSTRTLTIRSPELQVTNPDRSPMPTVPNPPPPRPNEPIKPPRGDTPGSSVDVQPSSVAPPGALAAPAGISIREKSRNASAVTVTVSWSAPAGSVVGYVVTASGGFTGGSLSSQVAGTSTDFALPCGGSTFCTNGRVDVSVSASSGSATGPAGVGSWTVTGGAPVTTTTKPPVVPTTPPVVPTTTAPPVVPTTTTPPPPPPLPPAGAVVITSITGLQTSYTRKVNMAPPAAWANHNGRCEVVNTTMGMSTAIACNATLANIDVDYGTNRIVVRAFAASGAGQVDSAPKSVVMREQDMCGTKPCQIPRSIESNTAPAGVGGLGLLACAYLLRIRRREEEE